MINFVAIQSSPLPAAGVTDRLWSVGDIVTVLEAWRAELMSLTAKVLLAYLIALSVVLAWIFRFSIAATNANGFGDVIVADRWFGTVKVCSVAVRECVSVYPRPTKSN